MEIQLFSIILYHKTKLTILLHHLVGGLVLAALPLPPGNSHLVLTCMTDDMIPPMLELTTMWCIVE